MGILNNELIGKGLEKVNPDNIKTIYNLLQDDLSKYIFENRMMYSLTDDMRYIRNVVYSVGGVRDIHDCLIENKKTVGIFGAGTIGKDLVKIFCDIKFECFVDNICNGNMCEGIPVISLLEFKEKYPDGIILISSKLYHQEMLQQLLDEGFLKKSIINIGKVAKELEKLQYFDLPQLKEERKEKEIFVDGGCYNGSSSIGFLDWCHGNGFVYAWEPDPSNVKVCEGLFETNDISYQLIPKGLWSESKELKFKTGMGQLSTITDAGDIKIEVDSIDRLIKEPVTFIKMDIQGAEYEALLGAEKMIADYKPKLAICVYHKQEDIWKLPYLIHELNAEYKFYLRHYSFRQVDTILYAL